MLQTKRKRTLFESHESPCVRRGETLASEGPPVTFVTFPQVTSRTQSTAMRSRWLKPCLVIASTLALSSLLEAKQLAVVTDSENPTVNVSAAELQKIFNLRTHNWADGKAVIVVMRNPSATEMQLVLRKLLNMTPEQASAFVETHKGAVVIADSDDAVIRFVASNRGAIGVVDLYSLTKDVRVVKVDGKLPVEQGYLLRGE